jgi:shikimate kinase
MGAGKSSVGAAIAHRLGWVLSDSDVEIHRATGKTVRELRDEVGVDAMHAYEAAHLLEAVARTQPAVICAAASVVDDSRCTEALKDTTVFVIWLRATPGTLAKRFASGAHRPPYGDDPEAFLARQSAERSHLFASLSDVIVDVDGLTVDEATNAALTAVRRTSRP